VDGLSSRRAWSSCISQPSAVRRSIASRWKPSRQSYSVDSHDCGTVTRLCCIRPPSSDALAVLKVTSTFAHEKSPGRLLRKLLRIVLGTAGRHAVHRWLPGPQEDAWPWVVALTANVDALENVSSSSEEAEDAQLNPKRSLKSNCRTHVNHC
jgi:hypothetical protein